MANGTDNRSIIETSTLTRQEARLKVLPLFMGMAKKDLEDISRSIHYNRKHYKKGNAIVSEGTSCRSLVIVTDGWVRAVTYNDSRAYRIEETMQAIMTIEPDKLFGMRTIYHSTYVAHTTCDVYEINKDELLRLMERHFIVRLNLLNMICHRTQHLEHQLWTKRQDNTATAIVDFVKRHVQYPAGRKTLYIKMTQLALELGYSRTEISRALNALADAERIIIKRGIVEIPALQLL